MHKMSTIQAQEQSSSNRPFTRRDFLSTSLKAGAAAFTTSLLSSYHAAAEGKYNVLFIIVDDLRPLLGCYGHPEMHTPNIDGLAQRGTLFNRAYCQFPVCNPSRASILTGLRPETNGVLDNSTYFRQTAPDAITFPEHFKAHGYHTRSVGKIAHGPAKLDDELSWSVPRWRAKLPRYSGIPSWQALDVADDELRDGQIAKQAIEVLEEIQDLQFLLAVGFRKPHMPFNAPTKYYDLYDTPIFKNVPSVAPNSTNEIRQYYSDIPPGNDPLSEEKTLELIQGYAASTSYMDAQVGRVLEQLDTLGLTERTVIVFVGDHGFHLGEHGEWAKRTLFEVALRSPLIVSFPGQTPLGVNTDALVELVDIYPTLCDLCQLPIPSQLEGISMVPVLKEPARSWKTAAFSTVGKENGKRSIRTQRYRYTESKISLVRGKELYDYEVDPDETVNMAFLPENEELAARLSERLHAGWQAALPGVSEQIRIPQMLPWDINNDGIVDIRDLIMVSNSFGVAVSEHPKADVNKDGNVDIIDLLLVAAHFGESSDSTAPSTRPNIRPEQFDIVEKWLTEARLADDGSTVFWQGIATLERLFNIAAPTETVLLPNYPNPFNPETWIPYDLADDANVYVHIYNATGESIRRLSLGFQTAGTYRARSRAAYWDGRNAAGETVASGIYFYTLQAGQFKTTRQMVIIK